MLQRLNRRSFLRGTGAVLALPWLDALARTTSAAENTSPRRMVFCATTLGIHGENFFPTESGKGFSLPPYLVALKDFRDAWTVFSGVSHPDVDGGHSSEASYLTAAPHPGGGSFKNTISVDQFALEKLPPQNRFSSLVLTTSDGGPGLSYTRSGVTIPTDGRPSVVFRKLFVDGNAKEVAEQVERLKDGRSIMDAVLDDAKRVERTLGPRDRQRLDEYFSSVREVEQRLVSAQEWARKPKPKVEVPTPTDITNHADFVARTRLVFDLIHLALQTDSTRIVTVKINGHNSVPPLNGITQDWHNLSHHGKDPEKLGQLRIIEIEQMKLLAEFLGKLKSSGEAGSTLLDRTQVLYGSNLGNASSHDTRNMPMLLAGGGFKHGQHLAFDEKRNTPIGQIFVSMLQRMGIETDQFASGRGTLRGLEIA